MAAIIEVGILHFFCIVFVLFGYIIYETLLRNLTNNNCRTSFNHSFNVNRLTDNVNRLTDILFSIPSVTFRVLAAVDKLFSGRTFSRKCSVNHKKDCERVSQELHDVFKMK